jgi:hypothetical protein
MMVLAHLGIQALLNHLALFNRRPRPPRTARMWVEGGNRQKYPKLL